MKKSEWTKELVEKLKSFAEHRDYVVMVRSFDDGTVCKVTPVHEVPHPEQYDTPGWFGCGPRGYGSEIEDDHDLADFEPSDFEIYERMEKWQDKEPYLHGDD
jgi:hypothetical protein